jgi:hypothetical protein
VERIGDSNRKGTFGSPYAVKDNNRVNPELWHLTDLPHFVAAAHEHGMYVILDWVANHTAWDNRLVTEHPEWYARDWKGDFRPTPWWDWADIIDLDYRQEGLRRYMTDAMTYWLRETDIDGYRCDVAGFVPTDFWNNVRRELDAIKPVFMLAEWESHDLHEQAFDMTYAWSWYEAVHRIAMAGSDLNDLHIYYSWNEKTYPRDSIRMTFVSNHDMNAWEGTQFEQFGPALEAAIVLSVVGEGMPLIYNGQEAGSDKRRSSSKRTRFSGGSTRSVRCTRSCSASSGTTPRCGTARGGARMIDVPNSVHSRVLSFVRRNERDKVFAVFNFSDADQTVEFQESLYHGAYTDFFDRQPVELDGTTRLSLHAWDYRVFVA